MLKNRHRRQIHEGIQRLSGVFGLPVTKMIDCEIVSVDLSTRTAIVNSLDSTIAALPVRLMPEVADGLTITPTKGSTVTVAYTDVTDPYIVGYSQIDTLLLVIGKQGYKIDITSGKQQFNDGKYNGIVKVVDPDNSEVGLLKKINNLETDLNNLKTALMSILKVPIETNMAGLPDLLQAAMIAALTTYYENNFVLTTETELENQNITHGLTL